MRLFLEICLVAALLALGWERPFHDWIAGESLTRKAGPVSARNLPHEPSQGGGWMWEKTRRTVLDRPAYSATTPSATPAKDSF